MRNKPVPIPLFWVYNRMFGSGLSVKVKNNCHINQGFGQQLFTRVKHLQRWLFGGVGSWDGTGALMR